MSGVDWRTLAATQAGLLTRAQLTAAGIDRWAVRHRLRTGRWVAHTPTVVGTTNGPLTREVLLWIGVLHGGPHALLGDLTAAAELGLRNWAREEVTILVPRGTDTGDGHPGIRFRGVRRPLPDLRVHVHGLPMCRIEPAVLLFASQQSSSRTVSGVLAAVVQQRLTTPDRLAHWLTRLAPLRGAGQMRQALADVTDGAQSTAEIDVRRMCRAAGLCPPRRQVRRRDAAGRVRYTDCEWRLADGRVLVLEVDGGFHMEVEHWEEDIARQRALAASDRMIVRCTARELRDEPELVAEQLRMLGVPAA